VRRASFTGTKFSGGGKRGRAKIPSPQPPSFLPARAFGLAPRSCGAVSSVQKRFGFRQTNAPVLNFQKFCRPIQPREARPIFPPPPNFVFRFAKCAARLQFLIFGVALK